MTKRPSKRWSASVAALLAAVGLSASAGVGAQPAEAAAAKSAIAVTTHEQIPIELSHAPILENGSVYLPLRATGTAIQSRTTWIPEGKRIVVVDPDTRIEMTLGSKRATVNGVARDLPAMPKNVDGVVYVPVRFVSEAMGIEVNWVPKERRVELGLQQPPYLFAERGTKGYWIDRGTGALYLSDNAAAAKLVADTNVEIKEFGGMFVESLSANVEIVTVGDNYGEPHLNDDVYKIVVKDGAKTLETKTHYWGMHPIRNVPRSASGNPLLLDGAKLYEIALSGQVVAEHDLRALTGYEDDAFQVEWYDDEIMVVRPHYSGWLTLVDRQTNETTRLVDGIAAADQLEAYRAMAGSNELEFSQWDGLQVVGREGDALKLKHTWFLATDAPKDVSYDLKK